MALAREYRFLARQFGSDRRMDRSAVKAILSSLRALRAEELEWFGVVR
jgi:hypothetical protein